MTPQKIVPSSKFAEYSVGWICALPDELAAARAMLDCEHGVPEHRIVADDNTYFLGSVGSHNVVIAGLPAGALGAASAGVVAAGMQRTFTRVRVGLLVGIGSGAPGSGAVDEDVRLGDVVVSKPMGDTGGIIEFERIPQKNGDEHGDGGNDSSGGSGGKAEFMRTRCLNAPPRALLTALASLEAEHSMMGSKASEYLAQAAQKYPRMKIFFVEPGIGGPAGKSGSNSGNNGGGKAHNDDYSDSGDVGTDRQKPADQLYQASYAHIEALDNCDCVRCDARMLVRRPPRDEAGPVIHFGVIASGTCELFCGAAREQAKAALGGPLCFEREAAGLMDNFPCLVIRGIADYADSHRSVRWRRYAAAAAAACAKELLDMLPPREVESMDTITQVLQGGECYITFS
jgi:nucleoside phosphorylase